MTPATTTTAADARPLVAVTGATGFIGRHLVPALAQAGWQVRVLLRRDPVVPEWHGVPLEVVPGSLRDADALERLVEGASAVIHVAGLIKAATRAEFDAVNREGSAQLATITQRLAPDAHFLHVSTIAAREPALSDYAASKRAGEEAVQAILGTRATVLRPPPVYGPGDRETLLFFQIAAGRWVPLLGTRESRAAMIHVGDLVQLLALLAGTEPQGRVLTAADARPSGYGWDEVLGTAAQAVGNRQPRFVQAPYALLRLVALLGDLGRLFGSANMLNSQKLRELRHPDWSVRDTEWAQAPGWTPRFTLENGFADAVRWYRQAGWLR